jgi:hypothetical protein
LVENISGSKDGFFVNLLPPRIHEIFKAHTVDHNYVKIFDTPGSKSIT